jgi:hypothetical protein
MGSKIKYEIDDGPAGIRVWKRVPGFGYLFGYPGTHSEHLFYVVVNDRKPMIT